MNEKHCSWLAVLAAALVTQTATAQTRGADAADGTAAPAPNAASVQARQRSIDPERAVRDALANNASLIVAKLSEAQAAEGVRAELGRYPTVFSADAGYTTGMSPRLGPADQISTTRSSSVGGGAGLRRAFPIGTIAELRLRGERFDNDALTAAAADLDSPSGYSATARASLTQPLLRGAGYRVGEAELRAARVSHEAAQRTRERLTSELVRDVILAYDELWYAQSALEIERSSLATARREQTEAELRIAAGALPRADRLSFAQRTAAAEESVVTADATRRARALELASLLGDIDADPPELVASAPPPEQAPMPGRPELERAIASGSLELAALEAELRLAQTRAETAGEQTRPRLDVEGYVETQGVSERAGRAVERAGRLYWVAAHVGATFEVPLDNRQRRAARSSALLGVRIAEQNLRAARTRIATQAVSALNDVRAAEQRLVLAERTLEVARLSYEAARERFALGEGLALEVQQREDQVRAAALRAERTRVELAELRTSLLHLSGQLLKANQVSVR